MERTESDSRTNRGPKTLKASELLMEAVVVGIATVFLGIIVMYIAHYVSGDKQTSSGNYTMEMTLFLTGFGLHVIFESFGWNQRYCKYRCEKEE